jgi:hypothetical protein
MVIGDVTYDLLCLITNTHDKCLTKYDNYMVIGDVTYDLLCPVTNTRDNVSYITYNHVIVVFRQTFITSIGD